MKIVNINFIQITTLKRKLYLFKTVIKLNIIPKKEENKKEMKKLN